MHPKKYAALAQELEECLEGLDGCGPAEKLVAAIQDAAVFVLAQLDQRPELKIGVRFMLLGTAKALASRRMVAGCLGREVTPPEDQAIEECAVVVARTASKIRLP